MAELFSSKTKDFAPGQSLHGGRYEVLRPLSVGPRASVWAARDTATGANVVIKARRFCRRPPLSPLCCCRFWR